MKKIQYLFFFICLTFSLSLNAQGVREIQSTNIDFTVNNNQFKYTCLVKPDGYFWFEMNHNWIDTNYTISFQKKGKQFLTDTIIAFNKRPLDIDNFFPIFRTDSISYVNGYDFPYEWKDYIYELVNSYILSGIRMKRLYNSNENNTFRTIRTIKNRESYEVEIYTVHFEKAPYQLKYTKAQHLKDGSFKIITRDSCEFQKKKYTEIIESQLAYLNETDSKEFIKVDLSEKYFIEKVENGNYMAVMRPHLTDGGKIPKEGAITWSLWNIYANNRKK